jgi:hypothetical protein
LITHLRRSSGALSEILAGKAGEGAATAAAAAAAN